MLMLSCTLGGHTVKQKNKTVYKYHYHHKVMVFQQVEHMRHLILIYLIFITVKLIKITLRRLRRNEAYIIYI